MSDQSDKKYFAFYNRVPNSNFIFPDGTQANFVNGRYTTEDSSKAAMLAAEVAAGNVHIFQNKDALQLSAADLDPMAELKARIIADYEATKALAKGDMGTSEQGKLNVADSTSIGAAAADSSSGAAPVSSIKIGPRG